MTKEELLLFTEFQKDIQGVAKDIKELTRDSSDTRVDVATIKTKMENLVTVPDMQNAFRKHEDTKHKQSIMPANGRLKKNLGIGSAAGIGGAGVAWGIYELITMIAKHF